MRQKIGTEKGFSSVLTLVLVAALLLGSISLGRILPASSSKVTSSSSGAAEVRTVDNSLLYVGDGERSNVLQVDYQSGGLSNALENLGTSILQAPDERLQDISFSVSFEEPQLTVDNGYDMIEVSGCGSFASSVGAPTVPTKTVIVLLPPEGDVSSVEITSPRSQPISRQIYLYPRQEPVSLSMIENAKFTLPDAEVYSSSSSYPSQLGRLESVTIDRGYRLAIITLFPVTYVPSERTATYYSQLTVNVQLADAANARNMTAVEPTAGDAAEIAGRVINPEMVDAYSQPTLRTSSGEISRSSDTPLANLGRDTHEYVIITNDTLKNSGAWQPLVDRKNSRGLNAIIVTTEWIYANYSGVDNPEKIRNFVIDAYNDWGTKWVLLGGYRGIIPPRMFWVDAGFLDSYYGEPTTTYMPSDMYYSCLDGTFNYNNNGRWGEPNDGPNGGEVDLYAEVYVGRAAVENPTEVQNFVRKTLAYEDFAPNPKYLAYMLGEYMGFGGISDYATTSMEEIRLGSGAHGYVTIGFDASDNFTTNTLYDTPEGSWSPSQLINIINSGVNVLNHMGHADYNYDMKLYISDLVALHNTRYFFVYSQGCFPGEFDATNCFAENITSMYYGAAAVVMNAHYGWGEFYSTDGPSQWFQRQFWDAVFGENIYNLGMMNSDSKEDTIPIRYNQYCWRWCYYELNLFGDPELGVAKISTPLFSGGSGTPEDPCVIMNVNQLQIIENFLNAYFILGCDIDASATCTWNDNGDGGYYGFELVGTDATPFTGSFDGQGYKITNLYINRPDNDYVGLFGYVGSGGVVENVGLEDENASGRYAVGGLVGYNRGIVSNSYSTGSISSGSLFAGGIVGYIRDSGTVDNCYSTCSVSGDYYVGGLIGCNYNGTVSNSYSTGTASGIFSAVGGLAGYNSGTVTNCYSTSAASGEVEIGGLIGYNSGYVSNCYSTGSITGSRYTIGGLIGANEDGTVSNCYSMGAVSGDYYVGGLVGANYNGIVTNCYSTGLVNSNNEYEGGLVGHNTGTVTNSFWDKSISGQTTSAGGTGKATENMKNVRTYTDDAWSVGLTTPWDFVGNPYKDVANENIWDIYPAINNGYPFLTALTTHPYIITTVEELQAMKDDLSGHYVLGNDIDASATYTWNANDTGGYYGFEPIGPSDTNSFNGSFDGQGYKIYNLYINRPDAGDVGLFGYAKNAAVKNVGLENENISGGSYVGGLVGYNCDGTVSNCYSTGSVSSNNEYVGGLIGASYSADVSNCYSTGSVHGESINYVGGLVGSIDGGIVSNSHFTGSVTGYYGVGGLVGVNKFSSYGGIVANCYFAGSVSGYYYVGGLIGESSSADVSNCYSAGSVSGVVYYVGGLIGSNTAPVYNCYSTCSVGSLISGLTQVGGLIGYNRGYVSNCYSEGPVNGDSEVGGLIGLNDGDAVNCYSTGSVGGTNYVGGLIGNNNTVSNCYSAGFVSGDSDVGGLVGYSYGTVTNSFWDNQTSGQSTSAGGTGKTTANMKNVRTYTDTTWSYGLDTPWDFVGNPYKDVENENIWDNRSVVNNGYPFLTALMPCVLITTVEQLQAMKNDLTVHYALGNDINASATAGWNGGAGFKPIGTDATPFTGSFDGRGYKITNLYINRPDNENVGLFGHVGSGGVVKNVGLEDADVIGFYYVGGLVGLNEGTVSNCYSTGSVSVNYAVVGGLVGLNHDGTVINCYSTGSVNGGSYYVGGIAGFNTGTVSNSYSTGSASCSYSYAGGIVGYNNSSGTVTNCYSTGFVSGVYDVGGIAGWNEGIVTDSYSTGVVNGDYVGGIVGYNYNTGIVSRSYFAGSVDGSNSSGGLVGRNTGTVSDSYSTGSVSGSWAVGGLVGGNWGDISNSYSTGFVSGDDYVGGLIGYGDEGTVSNSFWDIQTSGQATSAGGTAKTTENMKYVRTYTDDTWSVGLTTPWDFVGNPYGDTSNENIWDIRSSVNNGYPSLVARITHSYIITTVEQLQAINNDLGGYYVLGNDIDASATASWNGGAGFEPIGTNVAPFTGSFDGRGYKIYNLCINRCYASDIGLFGCVGSGGVVKNVGLENVNVIDGDYHVGGLIGHNEGTVDNCYSTGSVHGYDTVGGLVGLNDGTVTNCYSTGTASGDYDYVGGLVGLNDGTVTNSYSTGSVHGDDGYVGGLVGYNQGTVSNSYSTGSVHGYYYVGGLVGVNEGTVSNCYSTGLTDGLWGYEDGLVGYSTGTVTNSFWDIETSGQAESYWGTGKTTENMKYVRTYTDDTWSVGLTTPWDFVGNPYGDTSNENIWDIDPAVNDGYPFLTALTKASSSGYRALGHLYQVRDTTASTSIKF